MKDSDPRPMPPQVLAAYRDPLNLTDLLSSPVFTDRDRVEVRDELLERLIKKHGNVEVEIGKSAKLVPIRRRVSQFRKNIWVSIEIMVAAEELGGREAVMLELATVMQPYWLRWWKEMKWGSYGSSYVSMRIVGMVLGRRQLAWLAAQYARSVVDISSDRRACLAAISAAETWAVVPSEENREQAYQAASVAYVADDAEDAATYAADAAVNAASAAIYIAEDAAAENAATAAVANAARAAYYAAEERSAAAEVSDGVARVAARLCELTKRLITPTLITSASRGLR